MRYPHSVRYSRRGVRSLTTVVFGLIVALGLPLRGTPWAQPLGLEFQVNTYTTGDQDFTDPPGKSASNTVATDSAGNFVVVWHSSQDGSFRGIFGQRYDSSGAPLGSEFLVNTHTTGTQRNPAVAADGSGNFVVVWSGHGPPSGGVGLFGRRYSSSGAPLGSQFTVSAPHYEYFPAVAANAAGDFVVVWQDIQDGSSSGVRGQRYDSSGTPQGSQFQVNTTTAGGQGSPAVALSATGSFVVVWDGDGPSASDIFGRRYDSSGAPQGSEFLINTYTNTFQRWPKVAADSTGNFVVVWEEYSYPPRNVSARRFSSDGTPLSPEFLVNTTTFARQLQPAVSADPAGNFVVVWQGGGQDGSGYGIFGQRYSSAGAPQGPEFQVNTYTTGNQNRPAVATDSAGNFVVGWSSQGQDGSSYGIFAQRHASIIPPCGNGTLNGGEDCDEGANNGTPTFCCTASCTFVGVGIGCRVSGGACDPAETCTGSSGTCPADAKSTAECRVSGGVCDPAENCDGVNNGCPPDAKSTAECRVSGGVCDPAENCDGVNNGCPPDAKSTAECRVSGGVCDPAENCDGVNNGCPPDAKSTAECRVSGGVCDPAENCDGVGNACPADGFVASGVSCTTDGNVCTDDECDGAGACGHPNNADPCDDGDACTDPDTCSGGTCSGPAITMCTDGDGCCPPGCGSVQDDDCAAPIPTTSRGGWLLLAGLLALSMGRALRRRSPVG